MHKLSVFALALGGIVAHPALSQSPEINAPLRSETPAKNDDEQFKALFNGIGASVQANEAPPAPSNIQRVPPLAIPKCYAIGDMEAPAPSANWARFYTDEKNRVSAYVDTTTIKHCISGNDVTVRFWKKIDLTDMSYTLSSVDYNCSRRKQENMPKSWLYLRNGRIVERYFDNDIGNPIPISPAYSLVIYICNINLDRSLAEVPGQILDWVRIDQEVDDVNWDIMKTDIALNSYYDEIYAEFWLRKDYSKAKWTKYRYSYSYDKIDCADARYISGQSFAFLPNQNQGKPVYEDTMRNIAPGSIQAAVMKKVCGSR